MGSGDLIPVFLLLFEPVYIKIIYICTVDVNHLLLTSGKQLIGLLCRFRLKQDYCYEKPVLEM